MREREGDIIPTLSRHGLLLHVHVALLEDD